MRYLTLIFTFILFSNAYSQSNDKLTLYSSDKLSLTKFFNQENRAFLIDTSAFFTNVNFSTQYGKAQSFSLKYKQELNSFLDLQLNLIKFSREGLFQNDQIKNHEFDLAFHFINRLSNYNSTFHFGSEKYLFQENGTILNYDNQSTIDPVLFSVALNQASNTGLNRYFNYNQSYKLSENIKFTNHSSYYYKSRIFEDYNPNYDFYSSIFIDSLQTYDSTHFSTFYNQFGFNAFNYNLRYLFKKESSSQLTTDSVFIDHGISLSTKQLLSNYYFEADLNYFKSSSYFGSLTLGNPDTTFLLQLLSEQSLVSVFTNKYQSNYFQFNTNFKSYNRHQALFTFSKNRFDFTTILSFLSNYVYLNQAQVFNQIPDQFYHINSKLGVSWKLGLFNGAHNFTYEHSSNTDIYRVPQYRLLSDIYINPILFEQSLDLKIGSTLSYFSSYYPNAYSPALGHFYLQDDQLFGDFPFLTVYAKIMIESVNVEFQLANLFDRLSDQTFYDTPNIPYYRSPFQLLVSWQLD
jgi:hypothetical protein